MDLEVLKSYTYLQKSPIVGSSLEDLLKTSLSAFE